jgi:hypothetical protein
VAAVRKIRAAQPVVVVVAVAPFCAGGCSSPESDPLAGVEEIETSGVDERAVEVLRGLQVAAWTPEVGTIDSEELDDGTEDLLWGSNIPDRPPRRLRITP